MTHVSLVWRSALANDLRVFGCIRGGRSLRRVFVLSSSVDINVRRPPRGAAMNGSRWRKPSRSRVAVGPPDQSFVTRLTHGRLAAQERPSVTVDATGTDDTRAERNIDTAA